MNWTNEKPRKEGYHCYKEHDSQDWCVLYVFKHPEGCLIAFDDAMESAVEQMHGQWAGPIPEPTDDKCGTCGGEGGIDSGGMTPWGSGINIPCPSCSPQPHYVDKAVKTDVNTKL